MNNIPAIKVGLVAVSRDCFPPELSVRRRKAIVAEYTRMFDAAEVYECPICVVESDVLAVEAVRDIRRAGCDAMCVFLGNFGPEISATLAAREFGGPVMFCAAAEESADSLTSGRGDAFCGLLNAGFSLALRGVKAYIPELPVGDAAHCAGLIHDFIPVARALVGVRNLKIVSFGPRPQNFIACSAPIKPLFDLGVEIEENSELDLFEAFRRHDGDERIASVAADMARELGSGNRKPEVLSRLAQYELTLLDWIEEHRGASKFVALAGKCWPAFQTSFGFVPCYVNGRLADRGVPVACETDIFGALSEYVAQCVSADGATLLDINNTVPPDMYDHDVKGKFSYAPTDVFMGFHCGNTCARRLCSPVMRNQRIMARTLPEEVTFGTLEGDLAAGEVTLCRLQPDGENRLMAYVAQGEILPVSTRSFGCSGVIAVHDMARFYRHVLIENGFPHHCAVAFGRHGKALFSAFRLLGADRMGYPRPATVPYGTENPF